MKGERGDEWRDFATVHDDSHALHRRRSRVTSLSILIYLYPPPPTYPSGQRVGMSSSPTINPAEGLLMTVMTGEAPMRVAIALFTPASAWLTCVLVYLKTTSGTS